MRLLRKILVRGGIPAFFFFSWILELLWNGTLFGQLQLVPAKLSYWQAAGLWFLVSLAFAWVGIGARSARVFRWPRWRRRPDDDLGRPIEGDLSGRERDDLGERIERAVRRGFARWVDADEETGWEELGGAIARKIRRAVRSWVDE